MPPKSTLNHTVYKPIDRGKGVTVRDTPCCCRNEVIPIAEYMTGQTKLPPYLPYPKFLLDMDITHTAKLLYALLLDRANLSQANGWVDEQGRIYLIFPIEKIAEALDKGRMTVKNALNELTDAGLIERQRQGFSAPNRIYVLLPDGQKTVLMTDKKLSLISKENCPTDGQKIVPMMDRKLSPNNLSNNNLNRNNLRGVTEPPAVFGRYENVLLTEQEIEELKAELPDKWAYYVERLSEYIASSGKNYASHAATIRIWAAEDKAKCAPKQGVPQTWGGLNQTIPDYTRTEGKSL